jgi:hypothetical protein
MLVLLAAILLAGASEPARKQYRTFARGNLQARGPIQPNGEARYVSLLIGQPGKPLEAEPPFFIRLGDGQVLESSDFSIGRIAGLAGAGKLTLERSDWGPGTVEYSYEGMVFVFKKDRCVAFRANWVQLPNRVYAPEIGSPQSNAFFKMPLTQDQLKTIFGPAEEIRDKSSL